MRRGKGRRTSHQRLIPSSFLNSQAAMPLTKSFLFFFGREEGRWEDEAEAEEARLKRLEGGGRKS